METAMNHLMSMWARILRAISLLLCLFHNQVAAVDEQTRVEDKQSHRSQLEDFYQSPSSHRITLSPDGKKVAWIYATNNQTLRHLKVLDLETNQVTKLLVAPNITRSVWHRSSTSLYVITNTNLVEVSLADSLQRTTLMKFDESKNQIFEKYDSRLDRVYFSEEDEYSHRIFSFNRSTEPTLLLESEQRINNFYHYPEKSALYYSLHYSEHSEIFVKEQGKEKSLRVCDMIKRCSLKGVDIDSRSVMIDSNALSSTDAIASLNIDSMKETLLLSDPQKISDREHSLIREGKHIFTSFFGDYRRFYSPIPSVQLAFDHLSLSFPNKNLMLQLSEDLSRWLVEISGGNMQLPKYYHYFPETKRLTNVTYLIEQKSPKIAEKDLIEATPLTYKARDGLLIQSYVWLPKNADLKNAPLISYIHGGPWTRVKGEYDAITQMLVSNGYIVFQPNFRASWGFGVDFVLAGAKTFGKGKTHNDIIDGIENLLEKGIGNRDKLAITGHSFGGFSVLGALAFEPDYFKAGFASAPPAQMPSLNSEAVLKKMGRTKPKRGFDRVHQDRAFLIDDRDPAELERFYSISPDAHKMAIKNPLIIVSGGKDTKVPIADVKAYSMALKLANKPVSLFVDNQASHTFYWESTWPPLLYLMERFFADNLGGKIHQADDEKYQKLLSNIEAFSTLAVKEHYTDSEG